MAMMGESEPIAQPVRRRRRPSVSKPPLFTRDCLDGRTLAAKAFDQLVSDIHSDLGGKDQLSRIQLALVEAFAGACVVLDQLNARLLMGEKISLPELAAASNAMTRIASRLGLQRRARDVGPTLGDLMRRELLEQQQWSQS